MERENAWKKYGEAESTAVEAASADYRRFLDRGKTERECAEEIIARLEAAGYISLEEALKKGEKLQAGAKIYICRMGKAVLSFHMGKAPLELHGVVAKKDGTVTKLVIGEKEDDPVIGITDLLPHLAMDQMGKKMSEGISGEGLDLLLAGKPLAGEEKEAVKAMLLKILKEEYGMEEEDFLSAEIEAVPAGKARDFGLDRSMLTKRRLAALARRACGPIIWRTRWRSCWTCRDATAS